MARQKVERLHDLGFDAVAVADLGLAGQGVPDGAVLALALAQGRIVLTHNGKDFRRLHRRGEPHSGIVLLPDDVRHALIAEAVASLLRTAPAWAGRFERLHRPPP